MSRSRKKYAIIKDDCSKKAKRRASKAVRRHAEVADGGNYKKVSESWDLCDYIIDLTGTEDEEKGRRK